MHLQAQFHASSRVSPAASSMGRPLHRALPWAGVASLLTFLLRPLWGLPIKGHDTLLHFYRVPEVNALLRQGILFARWAPDLMQGYGYPLFNFYPPLSAYLVTAAYWLAGQNALAGLNLAFALALCLACVGMFLLARELYGVAGGLLAAAAYALSPHLLYQTFQRGSISNALAMGLFPFAALALVRAARAPGARRVAWAAMLLAGVLLSHLSASLLFVAPCTVLGLVVACAGDEAPGSAVGMQRAWRSQYPPACAAPGRVCFGGRLQGRAARVGAVLLAVAGGLALAAFIWLPALGEIGFTRYAEIVGQGDIQFDRYFADLLAWPEPLLAGAANPPLPTTVGLGQLALGGVALGLALAGVVRGRRRPRGHGMEALTVVAAVMGFGAAFLATAPSAPVWERVAPLRRLQFSWRCLDASTFLLPLATARLLAGRGARAWWRIGLAAAATVVLTANAAPYTYPPRWHSLSPRPTLAEASQVEARLGIHGLTSWGEYAPATAGDLPHAPALPSAALGAGLAGKLARDELPAGALLAAEGGPLSASFRLSLSAETALTLNTYYFPGWQAWVDDRPVSIAPDGEGRLRLSVPAGEHHVAVRFGETPLRQAADGLSAVTAGLLVLALLLPRRLVQVAPWAPAPAEGRRASTSAVAVLSLLLVGLAALKLAWVDRCDTPLAMHLCDGQVPRLAQPAWSDFGGELGLLGYRLEGPDQLTLYWQALRAPSKDYQVRLALTDARGVPAETIVHTHPGHYRASFWEAADLFRDEYTLPLDESQRPIGYAISVAVIDPAGGDPLPVAGAEPTVLDVSLGTTKVAALEEAPKEGTRPVDAVFAGAIELERAWVPRVIAAGAELSYELQWKSLLPVGKDYTVFVHLLRADGTVAATDDAQPRDGLYPTSFWSPGETVAEEHSWQPAVAPGTYLLEVGLYDLQTGERLLVRRRGAPPADHLMLGRVHVVG